MYDFHYVLNFKGRLLALTANIRQAWIDKHSSVLVSSKIDLTVKNFLVPAGGLK